MAIRKLALFSTQDTGQRQTKQIPNTYRYYAEIVATSQHGNKSVKHLIEQNVGHHYSQTYTKEHTIRHEPSYKNQKQKTHRFYAEIVTNIT